MNERFGAGGLTLGTMVLSWLFLRLVSGNDLAPATCLGTYCFCEAPRTGQMVLQPSNAWSSFGFVWVGFFAWLQLRKAGSASAFTGWSSLVFCASAVAVGVGSFFLHATLTLWGQFVDVLGMYLISAFGLIYALTRWRGWSERGGGIVYGAMCLVLISTLLAMPEVRRWLFAVIMVATLMVEIPLARPRRLNAQLGYLLLGVAANLLAFGIWVLDQALLLCARESLFQGHAVWHLLGAVSVWMTYLYYRSERRRGL